MEFSIQALGKVWADFGQSSGKVQAKFGQVRAKFGQSSGKVRAKFGQVWAKFGQSSGKVQAKFRQSSGKFGQYLRTIYEEEPACIILTLLNISQYSLMTRSELQFS